MVSKVWRTQEKSKAFTLVELLIVIVVIVILATIVTIGYGAVVGNANDKAVQADVTKLADALKLKSLDNNNIPAGGATSSNTGDSTQLSGITFKPNVNGYDPTVSNLYYCSGTVNGSSEFAVAARSKSGKAFSYISNKGVSDFVGYSWTASSNGVALCTALGFSAPFTWSYGYNPSPSYGWYAWAFPGDIIKNIVLNPKGVGSTAGWFSPIVSSVTATSNVSWNGKADWYRYVWDGTGASTVRLNVNQSDLVNGQTYTASMLVGNSGASSVSWSNDWSDQNMTNFTLAAGQQKRIYFSASRATYDATYRFLDFNLTTSGVPGLLVSDVMITSGTNQYAYGDGNSNGWQWTGGAYASTSSGPGR